MSGDFSTPMLSCVPANLRIAGLRLLNLSLSDATIAIEVAVLGHHKTTVGFVNADCVNIAARNSDYRECLAALDWVFIDGSGMRIAGRVLDQPVRDNVNGTDLFPALCAALAKRGRSIYLLGGQKGVAEAAADWAASEFPGLRIAGTQDGYFPASRESEVLENIAAARPDVLLIGFGAPLQEQWIQRNRERTDATVTIGVGGLFDYYSGKIPRAPLWMRRLGIEWIFRLVQEPNRLWQRYLIGNPIFLARILLERLRAPLSTKC